MERKIFKTLDGKVQKLFDFPLDTSLIYLGRGEGRASEVYFFEVGNKKVVVKLSKPEDYWKGLSKEFRKLKVLKEYFDTPQPYFEGDLDNRPFIVFEYIEGKDLGSGRIISQLKRIGKKIRKLHELKIERHMFMPTDVSNYGSYYDFLLEIKNHVNVRSNEVKSYLSYSEEQNLDRIKSFELEKLIAQQSLFNADNFSICHKDLKAENIILTPEGDIRFIDLGFVNYCDPAFDLSYLSRNSRLSPEQITELLSSYGEEVGSEFHKRMDVYTTFCRIPCIIWHVDRLRNPNYVISESEKEEYRNYFGLYLKEYLKEGVVTKDIFSLLK